LDLPFRTVEPRRARRIHHVGKAAAAQRMDATLLRAQQRSRDDDERRERPEPRSKPRVRRRSSEPSEVAGHATRISTMDPTTRTPARLWKTMRRERGRAAVHAFWREEQAADEKMQAVMLIAQQKKFRPKTVLSLDLDRRTRHLASIVNLPETVAARALIAYHLAEQRPMMGAFLDALGIAHENGLIQEDSPAPDGAKLAPAAAEI